MPASATPTAGTDPERLARALVADNVYLTLATADAAGVPWASPLWFAARGLEEFVWASKPGARHSRNLTETPRVALVVFDSSRTPGAGSALYVQADARQVVDDDLFAEWLAVYNERSVALGIEPWDAADLREPSRHRLYRAVTREAFVLDDHDERVRVR